jgi:hypothetical protein
MPAGNRASRACVDGRFVTMRAWMRGRRWDGSDYALGERTILGPLSIGKRSACCARALGPMQHQQTFGNLPPSRRLPRDQSGSFPKTIEPSRPIYNDGKTRARSETPPVVAWANSESAFKSATEGGGASEAYRYRNIFHTIIAVREATPSLIKP